MIRFKWQQHSFFKKKLDAASHQTHLFISLHFSTKFLCFTIFHCQVSLLSFLLAFNSRSAQSSTSWQHTLLPFGLSQSLHLFQISSGCLHYYNPFPFSSSSTSPAYDTNPDFEPSKQPRFQICVEILSKLFLHRQSQADQARVCSSCSG